MLRADEAVLSYKVPTQMTRRTDLDIAIAANIATIGFPLPASGEGRSS